MNFFIRYLTYYLLQFAISAFNFYIVSELTGELESKDQDKNCGSNAGKIHILLCLRYVRKVSHMIHTTYHQTSMTFRYNTQTRLHQHSTLMQGMKKILNKVSNQLFLPLLCNVYKMSQTIHIYSSLNFLF